MRGISRVAEKLLASQEVLCCMEKKERKVYISGG
jgi:hypothetical protein